MVVELLVFCVVAERTSLFIVMEYCDGGDLMKKISSEQMSE